MQLTPDQIKAVLEALCETDKIHKKNMELIAESVNEIVRTVNQLQERVEAQSAVIQGLLTARGSFEA